MFLFFTHIVLLKFKFFVISLVTNITYYFSILYINYRRHIRSSQSVDRSLLSFFKCSIISSNP
nr:MAG TPA: hypothetical protein [Caudoviricetes sp.]